MERFIRWYFIDSRLRGNDERWSVKITVKAHPKSKFEKVIEHEGVYHCYFNVAPEKGRANEKVIELLVSYFGLRKCDVSIIVGKTAPDKIVEINRE